MAAATLALALARTASAAHLLLGLGYLLGQLVSLVLKLLLVLSRSLQGCLGSVRRLAFGGCLSRGTLGIRVELVGRVQGDLRRGLSLLGCLLGRIVSLLQWKRGGLGVDQRLVQGGLGGGRVGKGLDGNGHVGLGLLQLFYARRARQILRSSGLLTLRVGRFLRGGVCLVGLLHGDL